LLGLNRAGLHDRPAGESAENLALMRLLDEQYTRTPCYGVLRMAAYLRSLGHEVNPKRVRRLLRTMGLEAVYQKPTTSLPNPEHRVCPYLLRGLSIGRCDHVWSTEIVCTQMTKTHMFAAGMGGDRIADLDVRVGDDHPVDQEFEQLALLVKTGVVQADSDAGAEVVNAEAEAGDRLLASGLGTELGLLFSQGLPALFQFASPPLVLGQRNDALQVGFRQAVELLA
jgi:hypothetical protein